MIIHENRLLADDSHGISCLICYKTGMIFHENRLLADDSDELSYLIYFEN